MVKIAFLVIWPSCFLFLKSIYIKITIYRSPALHVNIEALTQPLPQEALVLKNGYSVTINHTCYMDIKRLLLWVVLSRVVSLYMVISNDWSNGIDLRTGILIPAASITISNYLLILKHLNMQYSFKKWCIQQFPSHPTHNGHIVFINVSWYVIYCKCVSMIDMVSSKCNDTHP